MAKALAARFTRSRFFTGFVCGAAAGAAASGLAALSLLRNHHHPPQTQQSPAAADLKEREEEEEREEPVPVSLLEKYGFPAAGTQTRYYTNHALSYDQTKRIPKWVIEHISKHKTLGNADRKHCKFRPDPNISPVFSAMNEDYIRSGWSRGHMAPAGDNKYSPKAMAETFYLSNIVPQNYENNAGFWNRVEMYCRELTERFEDVWIVSGPLILPQMEEDGKKRVTYQILAESEKQDIPSSWREAWICGSLRNIKQETPSPRPVHGAAFMVTFLSLKGLESKGKIKDRYLPQARLIGWFLGLFDGGQPSI
ncbi:nuclease EXOG, mitochondrial isoform X2 [Pogona vitticeps]